MGGREGVLVKNFYLKILKILKFLVGERGGGIFSISLVLLLPLREWLCFGQSETQIRAYVTLFFVLQRGALIIGLLEEKISPLSGAQIINLFEEKIC